MLHWLLNEHNKYSFLLELVLVSIVLHGILGVLLFVVYPTKRDSFCIALGVTKKPILFVPLRDSISKSPLAPSRCGSKGCTTPDGQSAQPASEQNPIIRKPQLSSDVSIGFQEKKLTKQAAPKRKKPQAKKRVRPQPSPQKKKTSAVRKPVQPAKNNKKIAQKNEPTKKLPEKKELPKNSKQEIKEPAKSIEPQKPQPEVDSKIAPVKQGSVLQEQSVSQPIINPESLQVRDDLPIEQVLVSNEPVDGEYMSAEQLRMYECIEQEIVSRWRPPCGLSKDLVCHIKCCISPDGTVSSCITEKSSGVLIYDMAARMASLALKLPRWAWGKDFTIVYKQ